ncbi:Disease resistance protein [Corchorus capsularis]|uniref:Disease resistance protein n=1 Tax=Corchorus capsularis TaxID=210143 RepID=A0A1R3G1V5_COCAP|nr:Disease resistance protein [Corchorus capsularis]
MDSFSIVENILEKVGSYAFNQIVSAWGLEDEVRKLKKTMEEIRAVLCDAEERQARNDEQGNLIKIWLQEFKEIVHDIKDVFDDLEIQDRKMMMMEGCKGTVNKVRGFCSSSNSIAFRFKMSQKISKIWGRLNEIRNRQDTFKLISIIIPRMETGMISSNRETHSSVDVQTVIGRDEDKEEIIGKLLLEKNSNNNVVSIISIVGLGGLGKTTLAKLVYNDLRVVEHFDLTMWVCVSPDKFDVKSMIKEIFKSTKPGLVYAGYNLQALKDQLQDALKDKKFLLVLDDVWNDNPKVWEELNQLLIGGNSGSKMLVTTRSEKVAFAMKSHVKYDLGCLSPDNCLSLLLRSAFNEGEDEEHQNLVEIGKDFVEKCKGNPLAAKTLGSSLYMKTDERDWHLIRDNEIWELEQRDDDIMPVLKLSYNLMPPHLKSCFVYCAVFPKGFRFNSLDLIQLWLANGLIISPSRNSEVLEYVGLQYLKELFSRCFFEEIEESVFLYIFKMHDLIHDLALSVAHEEILTVKSDNISISESVRHMSLPNSNLFKPKVTQKKLRTIVCQLAVLGSICETDVGNFIMGCKYLWVLDLSFSSFEELPNSIGQLKHLRYFSLSGNRRIRRLPTSISKLHKLQALGLIGCKMLERLPRGLRNMISLRFLEFTTNEELLPNGEIGCLDSLQVLTISGCQSLKFLFGDMNQLSSLQTLNITDCRQLRCLPCSVNDLTALENLLISNCAELDLENLLSSSSLRSMTITKMTNFKALPQWLQRSANSLSSLIIEDCPNFQTLPMPDWLKTFKSLKKLQINGVSQTSSNVRLN